MLNLSKVCTVVVFGVATVLSGQALAQECTCSVPLTEKFVGQITNAQGDVRVSQASNFTRAAVGAQLPQGTRILVGRGSARVVLSEQCTINMTANSSLTLIPRGNTICAALQTGQSAAFGNTGVALGVAGGSLLVAGGVIVFSQKDDKVPVSAQ